MLYRRTAPTVPNPSTYEPSLLVIAQGNSSWVRLRRGGSPGPGGDERLLCLRTSVPHVDRVSCLSKVGGHTRAHSSETEKSSFCSWLLLPPRVAHHVVLLCGSFRLHHSTATLPKCAPLAW